MKKLKRISRIAAILLILTLCLPFIFACGEKADDAKATENNNAGTEAQTEEETPTDPPAPTEPPTEKETEPPTEPPTDPADLPAPDIYMSGETGYEIIPGARYYLWSPNSSLYLEADKWGGVCQEAYSGKAEQMFVFEKLREEENADTGTVTIIYKIRALGSPDGYLDIDGGVDDIGDGQDVTVTAAPESEGSHEWILKPQKKTALKDDDSVLLDDFADVDLPIFSVCNLVAKKRILDVDGVSKDEGHKIHLWSGGSANNQKWVFELVSDVEQGKISPRGEKELDY
ncbi:MAG: RICIN domain-containing protein [Oscillospiraceae bacterium]|nr:RICIN domain-containing protein [Oscillospiraceae bacterium]